jgi:hypothetical protein
MTRTVLRRLSLLLAGCVTALAISAPARAEMLGTAAAAPEPAPARTHAAAVPERPALVEYLVGAGVPRDEAGRRIAALPDSEIAALGDPAAQPAGGAVVGVVIFVFALLVLTDALGYTDIFPFKLKR